MDLDWSPDDSSSFVQWDESEAGHSSDQSVPDGEVAAPLRRNGLLAIDDSDFQALIEILGTDGDRQKAKQITGNGASDERQLVRSEERRGQRDDRAAPAVGRDTRNSNENGHSQHENDESRLLVTASPELNRPSSSSRAPMETGVPPNLVQSSPPRRPKPGIESVPNQRIPLQSESVSSPGPSRPPDKSHSRSGTRPQLKANANFTQSKQYLGSSIDDVKDQVAELRTRLKALKEEVKEHAPHLYRKAFDTLETETQPEPLVNRRHSKDEKPINTRGKGKGKAVQWSNSLHGDHRISVNDIVSSLTEEEAKTALSSVCRTLRLDPTTLNSAQTPASEIPVDVADLVDVVRAVRLVSDLDELAWRNTNVRDLNRRNIYGQDNIQAIWDRVRLWERIARSRTGRGLAS